MPKDQEAKAPTQMRRFRIFQPMWQNVFPFLQFNDAKSLSMTSFAMRKLFWDMGPKSVTMHNLDKILSAGGKATCITNIMNDYSFPSSGLELVTQIHFDAEFKGPLKDLPSSLTHLFIDSRFPMFFAPNQLPSTLLHLTIGSKPQPNLFEVLPDSLTSLKFEGYLGPLAKTPGLQKLPPKLVSLSCPFARFQFIPDCLFTSDQQPTQGSSQDCCFWPSSIRHLELHDSSLDHPTTGQFCCEALPQTLTSLALRCCGGLPVEMPADKLPRSLLSLSLSNFSVVSNIEALPPGLTHICFRSEFNQPIDSKLPTTLVKLELGGTFNQPVNGLPPSLKTLVFHNEYGTTFNKKIDMLPHALQILKLSNAFDHLISNLPPFLKVLEIPERSRFNSAVDGLPQSLVELSLLGPFNHPIKHLPQGLKILRLGEAFNRNVDSLPPNLEVLEIGNAFDQKIDALPLTLLHLTLGDGFNRPVDHLPPNLITLKFGFKFDCPISGLPPTIAYLRLGHDFQQAIDKLPKGLRELTFTKNDHFTRKDFPKLVEVKFKKTSWD